MEQSIAVPVKLKQFLFHPTSVIVMFILDWGGFVLEIPQILSPFTLILTFAAIFLVAGGAIYALQKHFAGEDTRTALLKAGLGGLICAVPTAVMTTFIGTIILALSGFEAIQKEGVNGLINMFKKSY